jgi:hypothetical protein
MVIELSVSARNAQLWASLVVRAGNVFTAER